MNVFGECALPSFSDNPFQFLAPSDDEASEDLPNEIIAVGKTVSVPLPDRVVNVFFEKNIVCSIDDKEIVGPASSVFDKENADAIREVLQKKYRFSHVRTASSSQKGKYRVVILPQGSAAPSRSQSPPARPKSPPARPQSPPMRPQSPPRVLSFPRPSSPSLSPKSLSPSIVIHSPDGVRSSYARQPPQMAHQDTMRPQAIPEKGLCALSKKFSPASLPANAVVADTRPKVGDNLQIDVYGVPTSITFEKTVDYDRGGVTVSGPATQQFAAMTAIPVKDILQTMYYPECDVQALKSQNGITCRVVILPPVG